jgi:endonuclease/exonuclease/phosphatase family metal-dependent hydrolase
MYKMMRILFVFAVFLTIKGSSFNIQGFQEKQDILPDNLNDVSILTYNIWGIPIWLPRVGLSNRFDKISKKLANDDFDIVCLQECFSKRFRNKVLKELSGSYYHSEYYKCNRKTFLGIVTDCHGGLMTFSKFPIVFEHFYPFPLTKDMDKTERIGRKGFLVTKVINQKRDTVCIINTHLYAGKTEKSEKFREVQIAFMDSILNVKKYYDYKCVLAGDINVNHPDISMNPEKGQSLVYSFISNKMNFVDSTPRLTSNEYTIDFRKNRYCNGKDGLQKLDYIFFREKGTNKWNMHSSDILYTGDYSYSDHLALNVVYSYLE